MSLVSALVGTVLDRKYRIDRAVAEGGFGLVFVGHHLTLDTRIAVKVLKTPPADGARSDEILARFLTEAKTIARLRHPHIVSVLDSGVHHVDGARFGLPWIAFEWLEGETLRAELDRRRGRGGRSREVCLERMRPVLEAIACAHAQGVAHRDIKPSNILLVPTALGPVPRVLDFGIAKIMAPGEHAGSGDTRTRGGGTAFSERYAAPEQLSGARTGPWTDVHALALVLTEILTDAPAYASEDSTEIYRLVFAAERPTPARAGVDIGAWEPILARALSLKAAERPPDAAALLSALEAALGQRTPRTVAAEPVTPDDERAPEGSSPPPDAPAAVERTFETVVTAAVRRPPALRAARPLLYLVGAGALLAATFALKPLLLAPAPRESAPAAAPESTARRSERSRAEPPGPSPAPSPNTLPASAVPSSRRTAAKWVRPRSPLAPAGSGAVQASAARTAASSAHPVVTSARVPAPYVLE